MYRIPTFTNGPAAMLIGGAVAVGLCAAMTPMAVASGDDACPPIIGPGPLFLHGLGGAVEFGTPLLPPIPADFFGPGSEPFVGVIGLCGGPDDPLQGNANVIVDRLQPLNLPNVDDDDTVPIQIVALDLVSCQPITVVVDGQPQQWDVTVDLGGQPQQQGQLSATKTHDAGGVFSADLLVQPVFTFTRVTDQQQVPFAAPNIIDLHLDVDPYTCQPFCPPSLAEPFYLEPFTPSSIQPLDGQTLFLDVEQAQRGCGSCIAPDNGNGTIDVPAPCAYVAADYDNWIVIDAGLPAGTALLCNPFLHNFQIQNTGNGGVLGGEFYEFQAELHMDIFGTGALSGFNRPLDMPMSGEIHLGPRDPGQPVQLFPSEMVQLQGQLFGDADFQQFTFTAGGFFGMPSPGEINILEIAPLVNWDVNATTELRFEINYIGNNGSPLDGFSGVDPGLIHLVQGPLFADPPVIFDGLPNLPLGNGVLFCDTNGNLVVSNIGSSGEDGVVIDLGEAEGGQSTWVPIDLDQYDLRPVIQPPFLHTPLWIIDPVTGEFRMVFDNEDAGATYDLRLYLGNALVDELILFPPLPADPLLSGPLGGPLDLTTLLIPPGLSGLDLMLQAVVAPGLYQLGNNPPTQADRLVIVFDFSGDPLTNSSVEGLEWRGENSTGDGTGLCTVESIYEYDSLHRGIRSEDDEEPTTVRAVYDERDLLFVENLGSSGEDGVRTEVFGTTCGPGYMLPPRQPCQDNPAREYHFEYDGFDRLTHITVNGRVDNSDEQFIFDAIANPDNSVNQTTIDVNWPGYTVAEVNWTVFSVNGTIVDQGQLTSPDQTVVIGGPISPVDWLFIAPPPGDLLGPTVKMTWDAPVNLLTPPAPSGLSLMLQAVTTSGSRSSLRGAESDVQLTSADIRVADAGGQGAVTVLDSRFLRRVCPADCAPPGGNGLVNIDDLISVVNAISTQDLQCDVTPVNPDLSIGNGFVNFDDLIEIINSFGPCS